MRSGFGRLVKDCPCQPRKPIIRLPIYSPRVPPGSEPGDLARSVWSLTFGSLASWLGAWLTTPLLSFLPRS